MSVSVSPLPDARNPSNVVSELINSAAGRFGFEPHAQLCDVSPLAYPLNTQHTLLRGDNLDALLGLYCAKKTVKAIYIDPPYNTGKRFIYNDKFVGLDSVFKHQTAWMNFMLPRLLLAYELLEPTGVILVSIDDNVQAYLKILLDEVFGHTNFIAQFVVVRSKKWAGQW